MTCPQVSILIPVFNRVDLIHRAIQSAIAQTHQDLEVVVIDNQSTDGTWEVVRQYAQFDHRIHCHRNDKNLGPTRSWIRGLAKCRGQFVKILWSDDSIEPDFLAESLNCFSANQQVGMVFTATLQHCCGCDYLLYHFPHKREFSSREYVMHTLQGWHPEDGRQLLPFSPGCAIVRREYAAFCFPFEHDPELTRVAEYTGAGPDVLFLLTAASQAGVIAHVPRALSHFYASESSITGLHTEEVWKAYRRALNYFAEHISDDPAIQNLSPQRMSA